MKGNVRAIPPVQACYRSRGLQSIKASRFRDNRHMKAVRLSGLRTGCHVLKTEKAKMF